MLQRISPVLGLVAALTLPGLASAQVGQTDNTNGQAATGPGGVGQQSSTELDRLNPRGTAYFGLGGQSDTPEYVTKLGGGSGALSLGIYGYLGRNKDIILGLDRGREGWDYTYKREVSAVSGGTLTTTNEQLSSGTSLNLLIGKGFPLEGGATRGVDLALLLGTRSGFTGCGTAEAPRTCDASRGETAETNSESNVGGLVMIRTGFGNYGLRVTNASFQLVAGGSW